MFQVSFLLTGSNCNESSSKGYTAFENIAKISLGQVYNLNVNNIETILTDIKVKLDIRHIPLASSDWSEAGVRYLDVRVDETLSKMDIVIAGEKAQVRLFNPNGDIVNAPETMNTKHVKGIRVDYPEAGVWQIQTESHASHSVRVTGHSNVSHQFDGPNSMLNTSDTSNTTFIPLIGE